MRTIDGITITTYRLAFPFELEANKWEFTYRGWENVTQNSWRKCI